MIFVFKHHQVILTKQERVKEVKNAHFRPARELESTYLYRQKENIKTDATGLVIVTFQPEDGSNTNSCSVVTSPELWLY